MWTSSRTTSGSRSRIISTAARHLVGLAHHFDVACQLGPDAGPEQGVVVDTKTRPRVVAVGHRSGRGARAAPARTSVPVPGVLSDRHACPRGEPCARPWTGRCRGGPRAPRPGRIPRPGPARRAETASGSTSANTRRPRSRPLGRVDRRLPAGTSRARDVLVHRAVAHHDRAPRRRRSCPRPRARCRRRRRSRVSGWSLWRPSVAGSNSQWRSSRSWIRARRTTSWGSPAAFWMRESVWSTESCTWAAMSARSSARDPLPALGRQVAQGPRPPRGEEDQEATDEGHGADQHAEGGPGQVARSADSSATP